MTHLSLSSVIKHLTFWLLMFPSPIKKVIEQYIAKKHSVIRLLAM